MRAVAGDRPLSGNAAFQVALDARCTASARKPCETTRDCGVHDDIFDRRSARSTSRGGMSTRSSRTSACDARRGTRARERVSLRSVKLRSMPEAPLRMSKHGLVVDGEGWFVINARDSRWKEEGPLGAYCTFEGKRRFPHFGINISVLEPGERMGMYHREKGQETFLVLAGECTLIVEGEERRLAQWDFFYCSPKTH